METELFHHPGEALAFSHALCFHLWGAGPPVRISCGGVPFAAHTELEQNRHA